MKKRLLLPVLILLCTSEALADCINDIDSEAALIRSNICTFKNSGLVRIESVVAGNGSEPAAHRLFEFRATLLETFKGTFEKRICLVEWWERPFNVEGIEGQVFIFSADNAQMGCYPATDELTGIARKPQ